VRSFSTIPFGSLYRGIWFDHELAKQYASRKMPDGRGGQGGSVTPALTTPWVEICAERIAAALVRGDVLDLAAEAWAPNRVRYFAQPQRGNAHADAALPLQALRLLHSGAHHLRILSQQLDTLCSALEALQRARPPVTDAHGYLHTEWVRS
jgi:hypothetical protein